MSRTHLMLLTFLLSGLGACSEISTTRIRVSEKGPGSVGTGDGTPDGPNTKEVVVSDDEKYFSLTIQRGNALSESPNITFVLDTSNSMAADFAKLRDSLDTLVTRLDAEPIDYQLRFISMEQLLNYGLTQVSNPETAYSTNQTASLFPPVQVFQRSGGIAPVKAFIDALKPTSLEVEPGICAALEHLRGAKDYGDKQPIHLVVMSDEENATKYTQYDPFTGKTLSEFPLYCPLKLTGPQCVRKAKYNVHYIWNDYCYDYTQYKLKAEVRLPGDCERQGYSDDEAMYRLSTTKACVTNLNRCTDKSNPNRFSCQGGPTSPTLLDHTGNPSSYRYCEKATYFSCKVILDGVETTRKFPTAYPLPSGAQCTPDFSETIWEIASVAQSTEPYFRSCGTCAAAAWSTVYVADADKGNPNYENCEVVNANYTPRLGVTVTGQPHLQSIAEVNQCDPYFRPQDVPADPGLTIKLNVCEGELAAMVAPLPSFVTKTKTGDSKPTVHIHPSVEYHQDKARFRQTVATAFQVPLSAVTVDDDIQTTVVQKECSTAGRRFVGNTDVTQQSGFREVITAHTAISGDGQTIPNTGGVSQEVVYQDSGTQEACVEYSSPEFKRLVPNPDNFIELSKEYQPDRRIAWHSMISLDGQPCPGATDRATTEGKEYRELSQKTDGVVSSICEAGFDDFMGKLSDNILYDPELTYSLPEEKVALIKEVKSKTTGRVLSSGTDYQLSGNVITFDKSKVKIDEVIEFRIQ